MSREIATVNYIIHHDYFHIGIKEQASDQFPGSTAAVVNYIIQHAYFHIEIKEQVSRTWAWSPLYKWNQELGR